MPEKQEKSDDKGTHPLRAPELSQADLDKIQRRLAAADARRRNMNPRFVTIVIDGVEHAQLDFTQKRQLQIGVEAGASFVEVRGEDERGDLLLATHVISYADNAFELSRATAVLNNGKLKLGITPIAKLRQELPRATLSVNYHPKFQLARLLTAWRDFGNAGRTIPSYALAGLAMALIGCGLAGAFYAHKVKVLEQKLQQAHRDQQQLLPTAARAIISYTLTRDDQRVRSVEAAGIPEISLRLNLTAVSLQLPLSRTTETRSYSVDLKTFTGDRTLMTQDFLQPTRTNAGSVVEIVLPAELLKADTYYTVHLHSSDTIDHFTFKVVADQ